MTGRRWGTVDAQISFRSVENSELSRFLSFGAVIGQNISLYVLPIARNCSCLVSEFSVHSTLFSPILFRQKVTCFINSETDLSLWLDEFYFAWMSLFCDWLRVKYQVINKGAHWSCLPSLWRKASRGLDTRHPTPHQALGFADDLRRTLDFASSARLTIWHGHQNWSQKKNS